MSGAVIACVDVRSGEPFRYYAQHLLASGDVDSAWTPGGDGLCLGTTDDLHQVLCRDGSGGVFAGWVDARGRDTDIELQHFAAGGAIQAGWPAAGLPICTAPYSQYNLDLASDGTGGVYLVWQDFRAGMNGDIYAQHVSVRGQLVSGWPAGGLAVCTQEAEQAFPRIAPDGSGGALVIWQDRRSGRLALWAQHLQADGSAAADWPGQGVRLADGDSLTDLAAPAVMSTSAGQFFLAWRSEGPQGESIHAARIAPNWLPDTSASLPVVNLTSGSTPVGDPAVLALADGGVIVGWTELAATNAALRVSRLSSGGAADLRWPAGGCVASRGVFSSTAPCFAQEPAGGALVAWEDYRSGDADIYAQRIDDGGTVSSGWARNGVALCIAPGNQFAPSLLSDGSGGAIATWADGERSVSAGLLANRAAGPEAAQLATAFARPGHAHVVWHLDPPMSGIPIAAWRQDSPAGPWTRLASLASADSGRVVLDDRAAPQGARVSYRLSYAGEGFTRFLQPVAIEIPVAPLRLALERVWSLPRQNTLRLRLAVPMSEPLTVEVLDVMGRRVERRVIGDIEPGVQQLAVPVSAATASGVYFVRILQGGDARSAKWVYVR